MPTDDFFYQIKKLISQQIGKLNPEHQEFAMLNPDERMIVGACRAYIRGFGDQNPNFSKWLKDKAIPMLKLLGASKWPRTELTDLGLKLADKDEQQYNIESRQEEDVEIRT